MFVLLALSLLVSLTGAERLLDMSYDVGPHSIHWITHQDFVNETLNRGFTEGGFWLENYVLNFTEHISTHIDAPIHFAQNGWTVDEIPIEVLVAPAVVIDIREAAAAAPNALLTADHINAWIEENGPLPDGVVVMALTGWGSRYGDYEKYFGAKKFTQDLSVLNSPGFDISAAKLLSGYQAATGRRVVGVGIDTASLDPANSTNYLAHVELLKNNIYGLENVANLELLPKTGAELTILPLKTKAGTGGPCRILARIPDTLPTTSESVTTTTQPISGSETQTSVGTH